MFFTGCTSDEYIKKIYDKKFANKKIKCLNLKLNPYSNDVYDTINKLYKFDNKCNNTLEIKYKTNIGCNSKFNTNKQYHSFIQLSIISNTKLIVVLYKDLKDENINDEINKGYNELCKTINL